MEQIYTLEEAKKIGDQAIFSIGIDKVLVTADGNRFVEVESNVWAKVNSTRADCDNANNQSNIKTSTLPVDNILYVSASHHDGGVSVRPLYVFLDGQWVNILTRKKVVFR